MSSIGSLLIAGAMFLVGLADIVMCSYGVNIPKWFIILQGTVFILIALAAILTVPVTLAKKPGSGAQVPDRPSDGRSPPSVRPPQRMGMQE